MKLPIHLRQFVDKEEWTFAKTMPEWPHEYVVRDRVDQRLFEELIRHIRRHGSDQRFYDLTHRYFEEDGLVYWTMGATVGETVIINRCRAEDSFESRLARGDLPDEKQ